MFSKVKKPKISTDEFLMMQWEALQTKGKRKYVWINGVVMFGIGIPTFVVLIDLFIGDNVYPTIHELTREYLWNVLFTSMAAFSYTTYNWRFLEKNSLKKRTTKNLDSKIDFCYYCGTKLLKKINICTECGKKLEL